MVVLSEEIVAVVLLSLDASRKSAFHWEELFLVLFHNLKVDFAANGGIYDVSLGMLCLHIFSKSLRFRRSSASEFVNTVNEGCDT